MIDYFAKPGTTVYNDILLEQAADYEKEDNFESKIYLKELEHCIREEVNLLPEKLRTPYLLSREANMSMKDIALKLSLVKYNIPETFSLDNPGDRRKPTSEQATPAGLFEEVQRYATGELLLFVGINPICSLSTCLAPMKCNIVKAGKPAFPRVPASCLTDN